MVLVMKCIRMAYPVGTSPSSLAPCATLHLVDVELEPLDRVRGGPGDLLDAARADGAQGEHGARGLRRPRRGQLAVGMRHSLG